MGRTRHQLQISKKVREQLSLKCQIFWPKRQWSEKIARKIDAWTRYVKGEWFLEVPRSHLKGKWHITDTSRSGNPKKRLKMSAFTFSLINCFGVSVTRGEVHVGKKVSSRKGVKGEQKRGRSSHY